MCGGEGGPGGGRGRGGGSAEAGVSLRKRQGGRPCASAEADERSGSCARCCRPCLANVPAPAMLLPPLLFPVHPRSASPCICTATCSSYLICVSVQLRPCNCTNFVLSSELAAPCPLLSRLFSAQSWRDPLWRQAPCRLPAAFICVLQCHLPTALPTSLPNLSASPDRTCSRGQDSVLHVHRRGQRCARGAASCQEGGEGADWMLQTGLRIGGLARGGRAGRQADIMCLSDSACVPHSCRLCLHP